MAGIKGSSVVAKFKKEEAIGLITDPKKSDIYDIQVAGEFNGDGESSFGPLTDKIIIMGEKSSQEDQNENGEANLSLEINPKNLIKSFD